jgi:hypothetical protein
MSGKGAKQLTLHWPNALENNKDIYKVNKFCTSEVKTTQFSQSRSSVPRNSRKENFVLI